MSSFELPLMKPKMAPPEPKHATTFPQEQQSDGAEADSGEESFGDAESMLDVFAARDAFLSRALGPSQSLQTALEVSKPGDELEEEAEKVAEHVMRMAEPAASSGGDESGETGAGALVQRACSTCESEEDDEEKTTVHRDADGAAPTVDAGFESGLRTSRAGGGEALPGAVRSFMEPRFGKDFGDVRVHRNLCTDDVAIRACELRAEMRRG